ncbi:restriction endonuclease subunit S [Bacteroidales bacterium OttesenSCG-928-C19]|nr:restriction endonuclease subunit S [Bacteroidales bacterium OttesenSCG-928-C19]
MKIDKRNWNTYRFDEFAENISQRIEPQNTDLSIYVGLEHLDPDSLHIKRHGSPSDVEGTKLKFYKGDVIFGKRRAYQRKAALAEYDGICSAHAMVLRAKTDIIDERLFPFFFHSTIFQTRAIDISVGGLSPTINWKDLAKQEFSLPPKEEQARLAELLWAADEVVEREKKLLMNIETYQYAFFKKNYQDNNQPLIALSSLAEINPRQNKLTNKKTLVSFVTMSDVSNDGEFQNQEILPLKDLEGNGFTTFTENDILFAKITPCMENGKGAIAKKLSNGIGFGSTEFHVLRAKEKSDTNFCFFLTRTKSFRQLAEKLMTGSAGQKRVQPDFFDYYKFHAPSSEKRKYIGETMQLIEKEKQSIKEQLIHSQQLKSSLTNQIF